MAIQFDQNNINNQIYIIDQDENKVTKIADQNYTFAVKMNDTLTVFNFFDETKYLLLYLEYTLQDADYSEDVITGVSGEDKVKPIIIIVIVISVAIMIILVFLIVFCLCR